MEIPKFVKLYPKWMVKIMGTYRGISLYPIGIFVKRMDYRDMDTFINHELIHWRQQKEMLIIPFYLWYVIEWVINIFKYGKKAYKKLSFEQEAYHNQKNLDYLKKRRFLAWMKYLKYKPFN